MKSENEILLPGSWLQAEFLLKNISIEDKSVLIIGFGAEKIADKFISDGANKVIIIVDDFESLMVSRLKISNRGNVSVKMMDFFNTDFSDKEFDLIYSQGNITVSDRKNLFKEIKRVLKRNGTLCVGEIVRLMDEVPTVINDLWKSSELMPLTIDKLKLFYDQQNFKLLGIKNLTASLKDFYKQTKDLLREKVGVLDEKEKSYYKKMLNKMNHESNVYLQLGGDKFIGFYSLIFEVKK